MNNASVKTTRKRRPVTAKVAAERLGVSVRTVYRYVAEERESYESRAAERRSLVGQMKTSGSSWEDIAKAIDGTVWSARSLYRRYLEEHKVQIDEVRGDTPRMRGV